MTAPDREWVILARIARPQGRKGEVLADILTDFPERFTERPRLYLRGPEGKAQEPPHEVVVESQWLHKGSVVLKLQGVDSISDAELLRKFEIVIAPQDRMPLEEGAFYVSDLLGVRVLDVAGGNRRDIGEIVSVEQEGLASPVLVVHDNEGQEVLIPFIKAHLRGIDLNTKLMEMELPEGLVSQQVAPSKDSPSRPS